MFGLVLKIILTKRFKHSTMNLYTKIKSSLFCYQMGSILWFSDKQVTISLNINTTLFIVTNL